MPVLPEGKPNLRTDRNFARHDYPPAPRTSPHAVMPATTNVRPVDKPPETALRDTRRRKKKALNQAFPFRPGLKWTIGGTITLVAFSVAMWLTSPVTPQLAPAITILTNATVVDATSLMAAVQSAGLRGSTDVKGAIEEIRRLDGEHISIKGWAMDLTAPNSSVTVIAYAGGTHVMTVMTSGPRTDIAKVYGLSEAVAGKLSFQAAFGCKLGERLIVLAATSDRAYSQFRSLVCP